MEEHEPTPEQIPALNGRVVVFGLEPYADFSILTPFGRRVAKLLRHRSWVQQEDGTFKLTVGCARARRLHRMGSLLEGFGDYKEVVLDKIGVGNDLEAGEFIFKQNLKEFQLVGGRRVASETDYKEVALDKMGAGNDMDAGITDLAQSLCVLGIPRPGSLRLCRVLLPRSAGMTREVSPAALQTMLFIGWAKWARDPDKLEGPLLADSVCPQVNGPSAAVLDSMDFVDEGVFDDARHQNYASFEEAGDHVVKRIWPDAIASKIAVIVKPRPDSDNHAVESTDDQFEGAGCSTRAVTAGLRLEGQHLGNGALFMAVGSKPSHQMHGAIFGECSLLGDGRLLRRFPESAFTGGGKRFISFVMRMTEAIFPRWMLRLHCFVDDPAMVIQGSSSVAAFLVGL
eukprot:203848-Amphidinium_carterae.1